MIACRPLPFLGGTVGSYLLLIWHICFIKMLLVILINRKKVLGFDEDGDILVGRSKYSRVKSITNIEEWSEDFL
jgi:hypothetical protein